jgi:carbonic anhydrase
MIESTLLRQIGEANKSFLAGSPRFLDADGDPFVVVACIDPRLTGFLEPALGLPRNRAAVIRTAGNQLSERTLDALRSIAVALYVKHAREIVIVGHTDCSMAAFSATEVSDSFRKAGIPRSAFGNEDLRAWFGAYASIRDNLTGSIGYLRKSGLVPPDIRIHGVILDTNQGSIEVVVDGNLASEGTAPPATQPELGRKDASAGEKDAKAVAVDAPAEHTPHRPAPPPAEQKPTKGPIVIGQHAARTDQAAAAPGSLLEAVMILRDFFNRERQSQRMQKAVLDLKTIWRQDKSPSRIVAALQDIVHAYEAQYPNLPGALAYLEDVVKSGSADKIGFGEVIKRILD